MWLASTGRKQVGHNTTVQPSTDRRYVTWKRDVMWLFGCQLTENKLLVMQLFGHQLTEGMFLATWCNVTGCHLTESKLLVMQLFGHQLTEGMSLAAWCNVTGCQLTESNLLVTWHFGCQLAKSKYCVMSLSIMPSGANFQPFCCSHARSHPPGSRQLLWH